MPQTEKPDDLQFNPVFFCVCMTIAFRDGNIPKESTSFPCIKEPKDVRCQSALHLAISLPFTDTSMKMDALSVIGLFEKWRLRTKWSKIADCP